MIAFFQTSFKQLKILLKNYIGYNSGDIKNKNLLKSKVDKNKIQDMLIFEYSNKLLENMKKNYEVIYSKERELEKDLAPHTEKHKEKIELMNKIAEDITKIQLEMDALKTIKHNTQLDIKKDLNLKYIIET